MNKRKPVYLLAGGRQENREKMSLLVQRIFKENGLKAPSIAYVGVASRDDGRFFQYVAGLLMECGAGKVNHALIYADDADLKKAQNVLNQSDLVLISGGDVDEGMQVLREKKMIGFLKKLYDDGKPFFGLSAGSVMLAKEWVRWSDPEDDSTATLFPCLDFVPIICDMHDEEGNWEELRIALRLAEDGTKGYGITSGAAIKADYTGEIEALGGAIHQFIRRGNQVSRISDILP